MMEKGSLVQLVCGGKLWGECERFRVRLVLFNKTVFVLENQKCMENTFGTIILIFLL